MNTFQYENRNYKMKKRPSGNNSGKSKRWSQYETYYH